MNDIPSSYVISEDQKFFLLNCKTHKRMQKALLEVAFEIYLEDICAVLKCYASSRGSSIPTFRDNL